MTNINFSIVDNNIVNFEIKGHTNIDIYGNDIVCSAISSTVLMTINGLKEFAMVDVKYTIKDGYIYCDLSCLNDDNFVKANILTKSLLSILKDISKEYPNNVKLKIREV